MASEALAIDDLILDDRCQARKHFNAEAIEAYRQDYVDELELPPVEAVEVGGALYIVDGFHRIAAALKAGHTFIRVQIVEKADDVERAQWIALSKNHRHGVRRTAADKRKAIRMALENGIGQEQTTRTLAKHFSVSQSLVSQLRREWEAEPEALSTADNAPAKVATKDGRTYPRRRDQERPRDAIRPTKPPPSTPDPDEADEPPEDDGRERYAIAAKALDRLWQKLSGLLGADDPLCDGLRELHRYAKEGAGGP